MDDLHVEVENHGQARIVIHGRPESKLEPGDRVMLDHSATMIVRVLERDDRDRFNMLEQSNVTWDDIAGLGEVKEQLVEALELPCLHPDIYRFTARKPLLA